MAVMVAAGPAGRWVAWDADVDTAGDEAAGAGAFVELLEQAATSATHTNAATFMAGFLMRAC
jgi:hypothetical protein